MMATPSQNVTPQGSAFTLRIILFALASGLIMFTIMAIVMGEPPPEEDPPNLMLTYMVYASVAGIIPVSFLAPRMIVGTQIRHIASKDKAEQEAAKPLQLLGLYQTKTLIGAAAIEGVGFFAVATYFTEHSIVVLPVVLFALIGILLHLPTTSGIESWIERTEQRIDEQRMMNPQRCQRTWRSAKAGIAPLSAVSQNRPSGGFLDGWFRGPSTGETHRGQAFSPLVE